MDHLRTRTSTGSAAPSSDSLSSVTSKTSRSKACEGMRDWRCNRCKACGVRPLRRFVEVVAGDDLRGQAGAIGVEM